MHLNFLLTGLFATAATCAMAQDAPATAADKQDVAKAARFSATANTALDIGSVESTPAELLDQAPMADPAPVEATQPATEPIPNPQEQPLVAGETEQPFGDKVEDNPLAAAPTTTMPRAEHLLVSKQVQKEQAAVQPPVVDVPEVSAPPALPAEDAIAKAAPQEPVSKASTEASESTTHNSLANVMLSRSPRSAIPRESSPISRAADRKAPWYRTPYAALAGVLVLMGGLTMVFKKLVPSTRPVSADVMRTIGRLPLSPKQTATLLHIGRRIVLVAVGPEGARTLLEISDPEEVAVLLGKATASSQSAEAFKNALAEECASYDPVIEAPRKAAETAPATAGHDATQGQLQGLLSKLRSFQTTS